MNGYTLTTGKIQSLLQQGTIPWKRPWIGFQNAFNRISMKPYSVLNQVLVGEPGEYASYVQWKNLGGQVKKKEKAHDIVFYTVFTPKPKAKNEEEKEDEETEERPKKTKKIPYLQGYKVFRIDQVSGVKALDEDEYPDHFVPDAGADEIINAYLMRTGVQITEIEYGGRSCYTPSKDSITVPGRRQFKSTEGYYDTLFHELIHSTGAVGRLNRLARPAPFGSKEYAREELTAEIGSAILMNLTGMENNDSLSNNTAYIQNWMGALEKDEKCFVYAANRAEKAVNFLLGREEEEKEETP